MGYERAFDVKNTSAISCDNPPAGWLMGESVATALFHFVHKILSNADRRISPTQIQIPDYWTHCIQGICIDHIPFQTGTRTVLEIFACPSHLFPYFLSPVYFLSH